MFKQGFDNQKYIENLKELEDNCSFFKEKGFEDKDIEIKNEINAGRPTIALINNYDYDFVFENNGELENLENASETQNVNKTEECSSVLYCCNEIISLAVHIVKVCGFVQHQIPITYYVFLHNKDSLILIVIFIIRT